MSTAEGELVQSKRAQLTRARGYNVVAWCSGAGPSRGLRPQLHVATRAWLEVFEDEEVRAVAGDDMRVTALRCVGADRGSNEGTIVDERGGPEGRSNCQNPACNAAPPWCPGHSMYFDLPRAIMQPIGGELARFIVEAFAVKRDDGGGLFLALPACADAWAGSLEAARAANKPRDFRVELADPPTRAAADKRLKRLQVVHALKITLRPSRAPRASWVTEARSLDPPAAFLSSVNARARARRNGARRASRRSWRASTTTCSRASASPPRRARPRRG